jgi:hypothetical protein
VVKLAKEDERLEDSLVLRDQFAVRASASYSRPAGDSEANGIKPALPDDMALMRRAINVNLHMRRTKTWRPTAACN